MATYEELWELRELSKKWMMDKETKELTAALKKMAREKIQAALSTGSGLTTAPATPTAPTKDNHSVVGMGTISPPIHQSSQSALRDTENGPAALVCGCALLPGSPLYLSASKTRVSQYCEKHGVNSFFDLTVAPAAQPTSSTSPSQPSKQYARNLGGESVKLLSSQINHASWCAITDRDDRGCTCGALRGQTL